MNICLLFIEKVPSFFLFQILEEKKSLLVLLFRREPNKYRTLTFEFQATAQQKEN